MTRRRFPWIVLAVLGAWLVYVWLAPTAQLQEKVMRVGTGVLIAAALLLGWLLFFTGRRWVRLGWLGAAAALLAALFRYDGVTGDLIPIVRLRWGDRGFATSSGQATANAGELDTAVYPQFLGPGRDGIIRGVELSRDWKTHPPELLWRVNCGEGWAGYAVSDGMAITLEQREGREVVICCDLLNGAPLWEYGAVARYDTTVGGTGPRSTPAIGGGRVFAQGATGNLYCLDLKTGKHLWTRDVLEEAAAALSPPGVKLVPDWGFSVSPLIAGETVVTSPGGLMALRVADGSVLWKSAGLPPGYSSPRAATLGGVEQYLVFNREAVAGHRATDGSLLWSYAWDKTSQHVADPQPVGSDHVLVSSGYGKGSALLHLDPATLTDGKWSVYPAWASVKLKAKMSNFLMADGAVYGLNDGRLVCLNPQTGERRWEGDRYGHGQLLAVAGKKGLLLLIMAENGEVVLTGPNPGDTPPVELGRFTALEGKTWNPHTLAGRYLIVRNDAQAACYRLPVEE